MEHASCGGLNDCPTREQQCCTKQCSYSAYSGFGQCSDLAGTAGFVAFGNGVPGSYGREATRQVTRASCVGPVRLQPDIPRVAAQCVWTV